MSLPLVVVAPNIYVGRTISGGRGNGPALNRLPSSGRLLALTLCIGCLTLLVVASGLSPAAGGYGTHRQLGLQECGFLVRTGLPCPACGMTTSFAWFARGNLPASFYIQPMGCVLALLCAMTAWAGLYVAITGKPIYRILSVIPEKMGLIAMLGCVIVGWGWKIFIHLHGVDGWR